MFGDNETLTFTDEARDVIIRALRAEADALSFDDAPHYEAKGDTDEAARMRSIASALGGYALLIEGNTLSVTRADEVAA